MSTCIYLFEFPPVSTARFSGLVLGEVLSKAGCPGVDISTYHGSTGFREGVGLERVKRGFKEGLGFRQGLGFRRV